MEHRKVGQSTLCGDYAGGRGTQCHVLWPTATQPGHDRHPYDELTNRCWIRDLEEDGDVEPNPGPNVGSLSANGKANAWQALNMVVRDNYDIFGLQDHRWEAGELRTAANFMDSKEYVLIGKAANQEDANGAGAAVLAKRKLCPRPATELGNEGADSTSA